MSFFRNGNWIDERRTGSAFRYIGGGISVWRRNCTILQREAEKFCCGIKVQRVCLVICWSVRVVEICKLASKELKYITRSRDISS